MSESVCRWGFVSTAGIGRKNWKAIRLSGNGRVAAVASRSVTKAQSFIDQCSEEVPQTQPVDALGAYEELLARDDVDAVYLPIPTGIRKKWVIAAARAGKHVLCEKPAGNNATDVQEMIDACNQSGVQFMDGVMFDHSKRLTAIRKTLAEEKEIGKLRRIQTHFSFSGDNEFQKSNIRTDASVEPHGCLGDLGWYCIRFTLWAAGLRMPSHVRARTISSLQGKDSDGEVPGEMSGEMQFDNGLSAAFYCSFLTGNQQSVSLSGDDGYITLDDFVLPFCEAETSWHHHSHVLEIDNCRWDFRRHTDPKAIAEDPEDEASFQEVNLFRRFGECVLSGEIDSQFPELTLKTQQILDACRRSDAAGGEQTSP